MGGFGAGLQGRYRLQEGPRGTAASVVALVILMQDI